MRPSASRHSQQGVTLVIGLIMLVLITLVITTSFSLSTTNLRSVGNMQVRDEAIAATNSAIALYVGQVSSASPPSTDLTDPRLDDQTIDIDNDGTDDYTVTFDVAPECVRASQAINESLSSVTLPVTMTSAAFWNSIWEISATASDDRTGASINIHQGLRVLLTQAQKNTLCS
jgi:Tfp pilus assembly protein PilX